jgi:spermidine synthase
VLRCDAQSRRGRQHHRMIRSQTLDVVSTPDGRELVIYRRGDVFHITIDRYELMSSRAHRSEEELARLAVAALGDRSAPRLLVGGLGMGFTVRAALDAVAGRPGARIAVAEVFDAVIRWNREVLGDLAGQPLADPRVRVIHGDVADVLVSGERFDAILLDVDNGPEALTLERNDRLYTPAGLRRLHQALAPGGVVAVWSTSDDPRFASRLESSNFSASTHHVAARTSGKGARHVVFLGRRGHD